MKTKTAPQKTAKLNKATLRDLTAKQAGKVKGGVLRRKIGRIRIGSRILRG